MSMRHGRELKEKVRAMLEQQGGTDFEYSVIGSGKQRWTFTLNGRRERFSFALTPSPNPSALLNALSAARRVCRRTS